MILHYCSKRVQRAAPMMLSKMLFRTNSALLRTVLSDAASAEELPKNKLSMEDIFRPFKAISQIPFPKEFALKYANGELSKSANNSSHLDSLRSRQIIIENEQINEAADAYDTMLENLVNIGKATSIKSVKNILVGWYDPLLDAIVKEQAEIKDEFSSEDRNVRLYSIEYLCFTFSYF